MKNFSQNEKPPNSGSLRWWWNHWQSGITKSLPYQARPCGHCTLYHTFYTHYVTHSRVRG